MALSGIKKAHFIGIGGAGMSATAKLLKDTGVSITGSDEEVYEPVLSYLKKEKLPCSTPYAAENIPSKADLIVIGKNAKLVPETNREVKAALASGKLVKSFPEVLAELSHDKETIVVAGSYGKSTCAALLAHCLAAAGKDPSYFVGAVPITPNTSATIGAGNFFVLEGDEYPSSNTDNRAKFLHYHPNHLLITPLAHDHLNVFPTPEEYLKPFTELIELIPEGGTIVACAEGTLSKQFIKNDRWPIITYGLREGEFHAGDITWGETTSFSISHGSTRLVTVETTLLGEHNIQNIVGVAAFLLSHEIVTPEQFAKAVASFKGIKRRMEKLSEKTIIPMYEGFGSSFEKLRSAISAIKQHYPARQLVVVFEPHTFSWRNRDSLPWYDSAFEGAAGVYIFEPPQDGKASTLSLKEMTSRVAKTGVPVFGSEKPSEILDEFKEHVREDDVVLFSTSGSLGGLIDDITKLVEEKFPA